MKAIIMINNDALQDWMQTDYYRVHAIAEARKQAIREAKSEKPKVGKDSLMSEEELMALFQPEAVGPDQSTYEGLGSEQREVMRQCHWDYAENKPTLVSTFHSRVINRLITLGLIQRLDSSTIALSSAGLAMMEDFMLRYESMSLAEKEYYYAAR